MGRHIKGVDTSRSRIFSYVFVFRSFADNYFYGTEEYSFL